ncbi:hypothetical protein R9C00_04435 [Flammeovirgaceae bacterium SG7u.111]|nr:hypothetical protein [Flammeovirgaceae bacterium SG7u.132]WPO36694.1 hypothetical protein R9C00_04435 [Flammeovirgaceae bacterium SG7u.111]
MKNPKLFAFAIALSAVGLFITALSNSLVFEETIKVEINALGVFCMLLFVAQVAVFIFWMKQLKKM